MEVLLEIAKEDPSTGRMVTVGHLPFSINAAKVIERAFEEARSLGRDSVNSEHLLLSLFDEKSGLIGKMLDKTGLTKEQLREELLRLMGKKPDGGKNV